MLSDAIQELKVLWDVVSVETDERLDRFLTQYVKSHPDAPGMLNSLSFLEGALHGLQMAIKTLEELEV
jgi:hypothetical protein